MQDSSLLYNYSVRVYPLNYLKKKYSISFYFGFQGPIIGSKIWYRVQRFNEVHKFSHGFPTISKRCGI